MRISCRHSTSAQCPPTSLSPFCCRIPLHDLIVQTTTHSSYHSSIFLPHTVLSLEPNYPCLSNMSQWPAYRQLDLARQAPRWRDDSGGPLSTGYCVTKRSAWPEYVRLRCLWRQNTRLHILWLASAYGRSRGSRTSADESRCEDIRNTHEVIRHIWEM